MHLDGRANPRPHPLSTNSTVEVMEETRHDRDDDEREQDPRNQELDKRQFKNVKTGIFMELRITGTKML